MPSPTLVPEQPSPPSGPPTSIMAGRHGGPDVGVLRLVKVPDGAPPYDCDTDRAGDPAAGAPIEAGSRHDVPQRTEPSAPAATPAVAGTTAAWPRQLALVMVEILAGLRPMRQVVPVTTDRTRVQIRRLAATLASDRQPRIRRIVAFRPTAGAVEVTVVASFGPRTRALAMRFEHVAVRPAAPGLPTRPARWLCTEIEGA